MAGSRIRIAAAFLIGGVLVASAFVLSLQKNVRAQAGSIITAPTERSHIEVEDANSDGIPDWREALQKTEPIVLPQASSTYERPTTITGRFALNFIEDLYRSKMYGAFGDSSDELVAESIDKLAKATEDVLFTEDDIVVNPVTETPMIRAYGNHIAALALSAKGGSENEAIILQDALRYNEPDHLQKLEPIAASYVEIVSQMLAVPVPETYVKEHLDLLNAYNAIREDVRAMQRVYDDPLYTLVRMKRYEDDVRGMANALLQLFTTIETKGGVQWQEGESALQLKTLIENI